jgi:hypothetical protein
VLDWKNQAIDILNEPGFSVTDPGPLSGPILAFKIRRDQKLTLFIETEAAKGAKARADDIPPGTVRINLDKIELRHTFGATATLSGVNRLRSKPNGDPVQEIARIHDLTVTLPDRGPAVYAIEWLENLPSHHSWPDIAETKGSARAVMGNHEFNAIAWATPDGEGNFYRLRTSKNRAQHSAFLDQTGEGSDAHAETVAWFKTLPLWLDLGGLRVVLAGCLDDEARLTERGLHEVLNNGSAAFRAAEVLLKGPETHLPNGCSFRDKDGHLRHQARLRWWDPDATTFRTAVIGMEGHETDLPDEPVPADFVYRDETSVLFGHDWMQGLPHVLHPHATCLDCQRWLPHCVPLVWRVRSEVGEPCVGPS